MNNINVIPKGPCLIVLVGPSGSGKSTFCARHFEPREVVSSDAIREELTGDFLRQDKNDVVFQEFHRRLEMRLRAGQRAVADATHLKNADRRKTAEIGFVLNAPVIYVVINRSLEAKTRDGGWRNNVRRKGKTLIEMHEETFQANLSQIMNGDGNKWVKVIDTTDSENTVVSARDIPRRPDLALETLHERGYQRVRVIGDIHGNYEGLETVVDYADQDSFLLFLGDIVDYGSHSWSCVKLVNELLSKGRAAMVRGNHDRKIARYIEQTLNGQEFSGQITHGNEITINQFKAMTPEDQARNGQMMLSMVEQSPDWIELGNWIFVHAAVHHGMIGNPVFRAPRNSALETYALYGETDGTKNERGFPTRKYDWIERLPQGVNAFLGHQVLSVEAPVVKRGPGGSYLIFLDTGSSKDLDGKPGFLSFWDMDIVRSRGELKLVPHQEFGRE